MDSVHEMKDHKGCTAVHDIFYSLTVRYQILCFDMKMRWMEVGVKWMRCGMEWNMNDGWDGVWMNKWMEWDEMNHKHYGTVLMIFITAAYKNKKKWEKLECQRNSDFHPIFSV